MESWQAAEFAYTMGTIVSTLVEAMGMHAENKVRESRGESPAYPEECFQDLLRRNGIDENGLIEAKRRIAF